MSRDCKECEGHATVRKVDFDGQLGWVCEDCFTFHGWVPKEKLTYNQLVFEKTRLYIQGEYYTLERYAQEIVEGKKNKEAQQRGENYRHILARVYFQTKRILVWDVIPEGLKREALMHEIMHVILEPQTRNKRCKSLTADEDLVENTAQAILQVFRENPSLATYLLESGD